MKKIDYKTLNIKPHNILFASTSNQNYEMSRIILLEDMVNTGNYIILYGDHCSCYGFDDTEWEAIVYSEKELKKLKYGIGAEENELSLFIKRYFEF